MIRSVPTRRRLGVLALLALGGGVATAQSAGGSGAAANAATTTTAAARATTIPAGPLIAPPVALAPRGGPPFPVPATAILRCSRPLKGGVPPRRQTTGGAPPSQALLGAFAILRRDRSAEDALPAQALKALRLRGLEPVVADAARLLRSAGAARAWVVPVPDVDRAGPHVCRDDDKPREGLAVVAIGRAPAGGGGALRDLVRGIASVATDPCAGEKRDMLGVSGIVPDGVPAVFLTGPDGSAVRADVQENGFSFVVPRSRAPEPRYIVWTAADGTPHVQPVSAVAFFPPAVCRLSRAPADVTPTGALGCDGFALTVPPIPGGRGRRLVMPQAPHALPRPPVAPAPRTRGERRRPAVAPPVPPRAPIFVGVPCPVIMPARAFEGPTIPTIPPRAVPAPPRRPAPAPPRPRTP